MRVLVDFVVALLMLVKLQITMGGLTLYFPLKDENKNIEIDRWEIILVTIVEFQAGVRVA
jgi:hypothetical protein